MDWEEGIHSHIQLAITKHVHLYETFANSIILYTKCHYVPKYYHFLFSQTVTVCNMLFWKGSLPDSGYSFTVSHHKNKGGKKKGGVLEIQAYKIQGHRSPISFSLITGLHLHFTFSQEQGFTGTAYLYTLGYIMNLKQLLMNGFSNRMKAVFDLT